MLSGFVLALAAYLLLAALASALLFFPGLRSFALGGAGKLLAAAGDGLRRLGSRSGGRLARTLSEGRHGSRQAASLLRQHAPILGMALLVLAIPVIVAGVLRTSSPLRGFDDRAYDRNAVVGSLLDGEALVPPPPLPPDVFTTREVEQIRPNLGGASREWTLLDADFRQRLLLVYKAMAAQGYTMALLEGYRSPQRQAMLAAQSQTVTNAGAYQSYHQYGLAADSAFYRDGKLVISEKDPWAMRGYQLYGVAAEAQGLRWGGRWDLQDYGHVELKRAGVLGSRP